MHMNGCDGCLTHPRFAPGSGGARCLAGADAGAALGVARAFSCLPEPSWLSAEPSGRFPPSLRAIMGSHAVAFDALQHPPKPPPHPQPCEVCERELFHDGQTEGSAPDREHLALFHITPQRRREIGLYFRREIIVSFFFSPSVFLQSHW